MTPKQPPSKDFKKILQLAKEIVAKNNSKLYFVYLPSYYRYKNNFLSNYNRSSNYDKVVKIVNDLDIPLLDMNKDFFLKQKNLLLDKNHFPNQL